MPAFNEGRRIRQMALAVLAQGAQQLIVVDDGSTDDTRDALAGLDLTLLAHPENRGKGFALATGMRFALAQGFGHIITIDADGQHRASDIPRLVAAAYTQPQALVIAARLRYRALAPGWRRFGNNMADFWVSWACGRLVADTQSGFRLYPANKLAAVGLRPRAGQGFAFESALLIDLLQAGTDLCTIAIDTLYDHAGRASHYRPWRDTVSIVWLVAGHLLRRGLYPLGLLRALGLLPPRSHPADLSSQTQQR